MTPQKKREFRDFITKEADRESENDPIKVVRQIAAYSADVFAQLKSIRMLARELLAAEPSRMDLTAKWSVVRVAPK